MVVVWDVLSKIDCFINLNIDRSLECKLSWNIVSSSHFSFKNELIPRQLREFSQLQVGKGRKKSDDSEIDSNLIRNENGDLPLEESASIGWRIRPLISPHSIEIGNQSRTPVLSRLLPTSVSPSKPTWASPNSINLNRSIAQNPERPGKKPIVPHWFQ